MEKTIFNKPGSGAVIFKRIEDANQFLNDLSDKNITHKLFCFDTYFVIQYAK